MVSRIIGGIVSLVMFVVVMILVWQLVEAIYYEPPVYDVTPIVKPQ
jgi:hypothetical protein